MMNNLDLQLSITIGESEATGREQTMLTDTAHWFSLSFK